MFFVSRPFSEKTTILTTVLRVKKQEAMGSRAAKRMSIKSPAAIYDLVHTSLLKSPLERNLEKPLKKVLDR